MYRELLANETMSNEDLYLLDDSTCMYSFSVMRRSDDPVLRDLARRILDRDLFEFMSADKEEYLKEKCQKYGLDPRYYVVKDYQEQIPYQPYSGDGSDNIYVLLDNGRIEELSKVSQVVRSLSTINEQDERVFYPKEIEK